MHEFMFHGVILGKGKAFFLPLGISYTFGQSCKEEKFFFLSSSQQNSLLVHSHSENRLTMECFHLSRYVQILVFSTFHASQHPSAALAAISSAGFIAVGSPM